MRDDGWLWMLTVALTVIGFILGAFVSDLAARSFAQSRCEAYHQDMIYKDAVQKCKDILTGSKP